MDPNKHPCTITLVSDPDPNPFTHAQCNDCGWLGPQSKCETKTGVESWELPTPYQILICPKCGGDEVEPSLAPEPWYLRAWYWLLDKFQQI